MRIKNEGSANVDVKKETRGEQKIKGAQRSKEAQMTIEDLKKKTKGEQTIKLCKGSAENEVMQESGD